ncbi:MAG: hypothetical protein JST85_24755 [Acidobacteria bacterium]|nr:hypothetical protein [Acidobacteriota bacterium]
MGTHVIIDARTRRVRASLDAPDDGTTIFAVDLIGDTWDDFSYFTEKARASEQACEFTKRNRYVRAATAALFSHLDGVVSDIFRILRGDSAFTRYQPKRPDFCSLKSKVLAIHQFLTDQRDLSLPVLSLELKLLRDILNHPTVTKSISQDGSVGSVLLEGPDVYGIAIDDLKLAGDEINQWLNAVSGNVPYERFCDTKRLAEDFARALGEEPISTHTF